MLKVHLLLILVLLFTLPLVSTASEVKDNQSFSNNSLCNAYVKDNTAVFYFPIIDNSTWVWFQNSTKDNALEYSWEIVIESSKNSYKFGYYLFKYPGQKQKEGSLQELLRYAQISVFESVLKPDGGTSGSLRDDLKIRAGIIDGGVVVGIKDSKTFHTIIKDEPKKAGFVISDPVEENSFICNAKIEYY